MEFNSDLMKGSTAPIVLKLLSERQMYGYEIVKVVNERTGGRFQWKEGTLYPCLHRLEAMGMLKRDDEEPAIVTAAKIFWVEPSW